MKINKISISLKCLSIGLVYILIAYLPFVSVFNNFIPRAGWLKDIICILICICGILYGKIRINWTTGIVWTYVIIVIGGLVFNNSLNYYEKIDAFRYRCEYAISLCILFNSFCFTKQEIVKFANNVLKIIYSTGLIIAVIGVIELINPAWVHWLYGDGLTNHLSLYLAGTVSARIISTMGNPINLGLQMCLAIIATLCLMNKDDVVISKSKKIFLLFSIILFVGVAMFTYSRTAYLAIAVTVMFYYFIRIFVLQIKVSKRIFSIISILVFTSIFILFLSNNQGFSARIERLNIDALLKNTRYINANMAFTTTNSNLFNYICGHGVGNVLGDTGQYVFEFGYASILYESGILGLSIFIFSIIANIIICIRLVKKKMFSVLSCVPFLSFIVGFCCAMITEDVYFQLPFSLYFWLSTFIIKSFESTSYKSNYEKMF